MTDINTAAPPCHIHMVDGKIFVVDDVNAWKGAEDGVFATGYFFYPGSSTAGHVTSVLLPRGRIDYFDFDYEALEDFVAQQPSAEPEADVVDLPEPEEPGDVMEDLQEAEVA